MARFVVVLPLVPLNAGDEFTVADWPLHVTLVRDGGELAGLRTRTLDSLREAGIDMARLRARTDFRPHVTRKRDAHLSPGDRVVLDTVALIDMRPAEGAHHRSVVASCRLGARPVSA